MKSHIPDGVYRGFRRADLNLKRAKFRGIGEFEANDGSTYEHGPTRVFFLCWRQGKVINQGFIDRYEAKAIIDALLNYSPKEEKNFGKKELAFLEFVCSQCREPYATMASNAILWTDKEVYNRLKNDFPNIY